MRALRYLWHTLRHPERRDFVDQGLGIEARFTRCRPAWEPHLRCCREFQRRAVGENRRGSLAVLGCGRLYDIDTEFLSARFDTIECFDADPGARAGVERWARRSAARVSFIPLDLTGSLDCWVREFRAAVREGRISHDHTEIGATLRALIPRALPPRSFSTVFSCNLLSQLTLHWNERVEEILGCELGIRSDDEGRYPDPIESALSATRCALERGHRDMVRTWAREQILLIYDVAWLYYDRSRPLWQEEPALYEPDFELAPWRESTRDQWFWHIAPQEVEQPGYGVIHDVRARAFECEEAW